MASPKKKVSKKKANIHFAKKYLKLILFYENCKSCKKIVYIKNKCKKCNESWRQLESNQ